MVYSLYFALKLIQRRPLSLSSKLFFVVGKLVHFFSLLASESNSGDFDDFLAFQTCLVNYHKTARLA